MLSGPLARTPGRRLARRSSRYAVEGHGVASPPSTTYLREDTLRAANALIVNHHHGLPLAAVLGGGTLSSSDGQRFPTRGRSLTARAMSRYFVDEGISTYTHVSNQLYTYGTKVIAVTQPEATYVLDEILGNQTDLPIAEHATDTAGATLVNFRPVRSGGHAALAPHPRSGPHHPGLFLAFRRGFTQPSTLRLRRPRSFTLLPRARRSGEGKHGDKRGHRGEQAGADQRTTEAPFGQGRRTPSL